MKKVKDKKPFKSIQLRDLSPEDSKVIKDAMKVTNEKRASQALLKAAKQLPGFIIDRAKQSNIIRDLELQVKQLKTALWNQVNHQKNGDDLNKQMTTLLKDMNNEVDKRQTRIG